MNVVIAGQPVVQLSFAARIKCLRPSAPKLRPKVRKAVDNWQVMLYLLWKGGSGDETSHKPVHIDHRPCMDARG